MMKSSGSTDDEVKIFVKEIELDFPTILRKH